MSRIFVSLSILFFLSAQGLAQADVLPPFGRRTPYNGMILLSFKTLPAEKVLLLTDEQNKVLGLFKSGESVEIRKKSTLYLADHKVQGFLHDLASYSGPLHKLRAYDSKDIPSSFGRPPDIVFMACETTPTQTNGYDLTCRLTDEPPRPQD